MACGALFRASEILVKAGDSAKAVETLARVPSACPDQAARALFETGAAYEAARDTKAAADAYDRLDRDFPASVQAKEVAKHLAAPRRAAARGDRRRTERP